MTKAVLLGDVTSFLARGVAPKYTEKERFYVINQKCVRDWKVSLNDARFTDISLRAVSLDRQLQVNDILVNSTGQGTLGRVGQFYGADKPATVDSHVTIVRPNPQLVDPIFLGYVLKNQEKKIESMAEGSTGQTELSRSKLAGLPVILPDIETQMKLADILGTIDKKIELNRKMNETLERMGHALFRHYFINGVGSPSILSDYVQHIKVNVNPSKQPDSIYSQYSIPAYDNSMIPEESLGLEIKSGKYEVVDNSILVSKLNPATPRIWPVFKPKDNPVCSTEFQVIRPKKFFAFSYFLLTSAEYTDKMAMSAGGTSNSHRRVKPRDILGFSFVRPNDELLIKFESNALPWLRMIDSNNEQNQTLTVIRNNLLPGIISGKIKI